MCSNVLQLHNEEVIPPIGGAWQGVQHALLGIHGATLAGVDAAQVSVGPQDGHVPGIQQLDVRAALDRVQQVPLVDYAYGVVVVGGEFAPPVPEGAVDDTRAVLAVVRVHSVVEVAFLVTGDRGAEHDDIVGLMKDELDLADVSDMKRLDNEKVKETNNGRNRLTLAGVAAAIVSI